MGGTLLILLASAGRICVGMVFLLASVQKMSSWNILPAVIANYRLLPRALAAPAAWLLPPLELLVGLGLVSGLAAMAAALAAATLLAIFGLAMAVNLARGRVHIDCGCGQHALRQSLSPVLVVRNGVLILLLAPSLASPGLVFTGPASPAAFLTSLAAGAGFFLLYLCANILVSLPGPSRPRAA